MNMKKKGNSVLYLKIGFVLSIAISLSGVALIFIPLPFLGDRLYSARWVLIPLGLMSSLFISDALPPNKFFDAVGAVVEGVFWLIRKLSYFLIFPLFLFLLALFTELSNNLFELLNVLVSQVYSWFFDHIILYIVTSLVIGVVFLILFSDRKKQKE
jgi:hypothetical protein